MAFIDYYKVLGVEKNATQAEIRKAYRRLAKIYHTDHNESPDAKQRFQEINEANMVLSNPEKRKKYDEYGENWEHAEEFEAQRRKYREGNGYNFGGFGGYGDFTHSDGNSSNFSDFFEHLFGEQIFGNRGRKNLKGEDYETTLKLTLKDIIKSRKQIINVNGKNLRITIPAGVRDGQKIRIKEQGGAAPQGGTRGDLYITFRIDSDATFTREGDDLYTTVTVDIFTLILGGEINLNTLENSVRIQIKAGTQPDSKLRIRGKGIPHYNKDEERGDLYVTIKATIPPLSDEQRMELKKMLSNERHHP